DAHPRRPGEGPLEGGTTRCREAPCPGERLATPAPRAAPHTARDGATVDRRRRVLGCRLYEAYHQRRRELQGEVGLDHSDQQAASGFPDRAAIFLWRRAPTRALRSWPSALQSRDPRRKDGSQLWRV